MSWAESIRDSLQRIAPYVLWVVLALGTSILVAFIRDPLSRLLREAREQLRALNTVPDDPDRVVRLLSGDRKSTRLNSSHSKQSRMPSSA